MADIPQIAGRSKEIKDVHDYIMSKVGKKQSGILYIKGPPGTGKSMTIRHVLANLSGVESTYINCLKHSRARFILTVLIDAIKIKNTAKCNDSDIIHRLSKAFASRSLKSHIIVFDEMDSIPKANAGDLIRQIFLWTKQKSSKLIVIGIANTLNMTSRCQIINSVLGQDVYNLESIAFRPYCSKDILAILKWYLENDKFYEYLEPEEKALDMIAKKSARDNGDIRAALNQLRSLVDDTRTSEIIVTKEFTPTKDVTLANDSTMTEIIEYPTPPTTPPPETPPRERRTRVKANIASVIKSTTKRQKEHLYHDDSFPFTHQVMLTVIHKLSSGSKSKEVDARTCIELTNLTLSKFGEPCDRISLKSILSLLETQAWIIIKKRPKLRILLRIGETELHHLVKRKDVIMNTLQGVKI